MRIRQPSVVCPQLSAGFRFNTLMQSANDHPGCPHWLRVLFIGRRPKVTLVRIAVLIVTCFITFNFILLPIRIEGISMLPTCHDRQRNFVNRLAYLRHEPQRGDIVSVRLAGLSVMFMKRIIGLPGETVSFHHGRAFINDQPLAEPYLKFSCDWEQPPVVCGPNQYYVVGDNRSMPFEFHTQGRAERDRIVGKLFLRKSPFALCSWPASPPAGSGSGPFYSPARKRLFCGKSPGLPPPPHFAPTTTTSPAPARP
jgi:signal peptidase I